MPVGNKPLTMISIFGKRWEMDLAIVAPTLISSELLVSILLVPQFITSGPMDFGNTISLMRHKTFSIPSPLIPSLIVLYRKMKFLHIVG